MLCTSHADGQHRFGETGPYRYRTFVTCKCGALRWRTTPVDDPNQPEPGRPRPRPQ